MSSNPKRTKVFISYCHADKKHLKRLQVHLAPLKRESKVVLWDDTILRAGDKWKKEIVQALSETKVAILLISADFLASKFVNEVELPALLKAAEQEQARIIPVIISVCSFTDDKRLKTFQAIHPPSKPIEALKKVDRDAVWEKVRKAVKDAFERRSDADLHGETCFWNVPFKRNANFTGREKELKAIEQHLNNEGKSAISQKAVVRGLGGMGKTQTAVEYAYQNKEKYGHIFWVNAESVSAIESSFQSFGSFICPDLEKAPDIIKTVNNWITANENWLLIFDNADTPEFIKDFIPENEKGHVLITSRANVFHKIGIRHPISLDKMPSNEAEELLFILTDYNRNDSKEVQSAKSLLKEFGYFPLAIEQAGAYINENNSTVQNYFNTYQIKRSEILDKGEVISDYDKEVATTWTLNFEELQKKHKASWELLNYFAFLSPDGIPFELILLGAEELGEEIKNPLKGVEDDPTLFDKLLKPLEKYTLITKNNDEKIINIHRLVQQVLLNKLQDEIQKNYVEKLYQMFEKIYPDPEDHHNFALCKKLHTNIVRCLALAESFNIVGDGELHILAATYLYKVLRLVDAEELYKKAVKIAEAEYGKEHTIVARDYNNLGELYREQGKLEDAELLLNKAIKILEARYGKKHPEVATSYNNLALLYLEQGKLEDAESLFNKAIKIDEIAYGKEHPTLAKRYNNLASLYKRQGKLDEAELLYKKAIKIDETAYGKEHPTVAIDYNNLALFYQEQGKLEDAELLYKKAIGILKNVYGEEHSFYEKAIYNYFGLLWELRQNKEADALEGESG